MTKIDTSTQRWWDLPAASLLLVALLTAATRLTATQWTRYLDITQTLVVFGLILGLAMGQSRFSPRLCALLTLAYGAVAVPWQLGMTLKSELPWMERMTILLNRLGVIIYQLINQEAVQDSLLFLVLMGALYWVLSVHAGYILVRYGNAWLAVLPAGLTMFVIHTFDPLVIRRAWYLAIYLFFSLVLVARISFLHRHDRWRQSHTALPPHLGFDFIRFALVATAVIVLFAWTVPAMASALPAAERAWQPVKQVWNQARDRFDNAFASLRATVGVVSDYYGPSALLGRGNPLTDAMVFTVKIPTNAPPSVRFYWRARTYDTYNNGQWISTGNTTQFFDPNEDELKLSNHDGRYAATFEIISAADMTTLFYPPQALWVNRPGQVEFINLPDDTVDVSSFRASPSLSSGQVYRVQASVSHPTVAQLMAAGNEYPDWITERYLQLSDSITPRTRQLAEEITLDAVTPYEKAMAVTEYLRANIEYVDSIIETPPQNQEIIDWFLFDLQKGFCNYYATAEVVLLRSLGIPARWSVGFAQGDRYEGELYEGDRYGGSFIVRQRDAHAWPEVYFPNVGWVEFEPTASQPILVRLPGDTTEGLGSDLPPDSDDEMRRHLMEDELAALREERGLSRRNSADPQQNLLNVVYWILPLALGILMLLVWRFRDRIDLQAVPIKLEATLIKAGIKPPEIIQLWARRAALPPMAKAYLEINNALSRLGKRPAVDETPAERATELGQVLPPADVPAHSLVNEYQVETFSTQLANLPAARQAGSEIRVLSIKAWLRRLLARLQQPSRPTRQPR